LTKASNFVEISGKDAEEILGIILPHVVWDMDA
jgi:hypothetical protein